MKKVVRYMSSVMILLGVCVIAVDAFARSSVHHTGSNDISANDGVVHSTNTSNENPGIWDKTKEVTGDVWNGTKEVSSDVWDGTKRVTKDVWDGTKKVGSDVSDAVTGKDGAPTSAPAASHAE